MNRNVSNASLIDRPLRVMFFTTDMTVGGEEVLLADLLRRLDRTRFAPELCCLKFLGELGELLANEIPVHTGLLAHKYDLRVWGRVTRILRNRQIDAVVTVGTGGDKMFWGRLAALRAGVKVIVSSIHSTGFPVRVEFPNRLLAPLTDAFVAVAQGHARHLVAREGCPAHKVRVIPNGVDADRFRPLAPSAALRREVGLPEGVPVAGLVAVVRQEKNHALWLQMAAQVRRQLPSAHFLIVGDGPDLPKYQELAATLGLADAVHFCGNRLDVPELLNLMDVFVLSSDIEASPVSILEAMACGKPVVSTRVGSIAESVVEGETGYLCPPKDAQALTGPVVELLANPHKAQQMGRAGRQRVEGHCSVRRMVEGYQDLIAEIYARKVATPARRVAVARLSDRSEASTPIAAATVGESP